MILLGALKFVDFLNHNIMEIESQNYKKYEAMKKNSKIQYLNSKQYKSAQKEQL